jgi:hypothetical protein
MPEMVFTGEVSMHRLDMKWQSAAMALADQTNARPSRQW